MQQAENTLFQLGMVSKKSLDLGRFNNMMRIKNKILCEQRVREPDAKLNTWTRYKDLLVLFIGALLGILSSTFAVSQQAHFQHNQALAEKRFAILREIVEINNESWRKMDGHLDAMEGFITNLSSKIVSYEGKNFNKFMIDSALTETDKADKVEKEIDIDTRQYESKMETLMTLLAYTTNQDPGKLLIDMEFKSFEGRIQSINDSFIKSIENGTTDIEYKAGWRKYSDDLKKVMKDTRNSLKVDRSRVNMEIRKIAQSVLEL